MSEILLRGNYHIFTVIFALNLHEEERDETETNEC
jgi:hypothetical protein